MCFIIIDKKKYVVIINMKRSARANPTLIKLNQPKLEFSSEELALYVFTGNQCFY